MSAWLHWICLWLADYYLSATILLAAVLAIGTVLREPVKRMSLAWGTLVGLPVLALLCAAPFWPRLSIVKSADEIVSAAAPREPTPVTPIPTVALPPLQVRSPAPNIGALPQPVEHVEFHPPQVAPVARAAEPLDFSLLAAAIFLIGSAAMMLWLMVGAIYSRRLCRTATPAPKFVEQELQAITHEISLSPGERVGVRALPRLLISRLIHTAAAYGLLRPAILLPEDVLTSEPFLAVQRGASPAATRTSLSASASLRTLLAHELAHIQRRDLWLLASSRLLLVVLFAHPLYWLLRGRIRADQELIADAIAAEVCGRHQYAENLVHWARRQPTALPRLAGALGIWERPSQLSRRIAMLLDERIHLQTFCARRWRMSTTLLFGALVTALSFLTMRPMPVAKAEPPAKQADAKSETAPQTDNDAKNPLPPWLQSLPDKITFSGMCLDENKNPLPNVLVRLVLVDNIQTPLVDRSQVDVGSFTADRVAKLQHELQRTKSDEKGRFEFPDISTAKLKTPLNAGFYITAQAAGRASATSFYIPYYQEHGSLQPELTLPPAGTLQGRITDATGKPVKGALVSSPMSFAPESGPLLGINTALTDADGQYQITDLRAYDLATENQKIQQQNLNARGFWGPISVFVEHPNYAHQVAAHRHVPAKVDITLYKPMVIEGQVLWDDDGKPASGIELELEHVDETDFFTQLSGKVQTDSNGHYHLATLPPGNYTLKPYLKPGDGGPDADRLAVNLPEGKQILNLRLDRNGVVRWHETQTSNEARRTSNPAAPKPNDGSSAVDRGVDIVVQRAGGTATTTNSLPEELGRQIEKLKGVDHVIGGLLDMVSFPDKDVVSALLNGWPPGCPLFERLKIQSGRQLLAGDKNKILLGSELARRLDKKVGDELELYNSSSFEVIGIYESPTKFENNGAVLPLAELQQMMNCPGVVTGFTVVAKRPIDAEGLKDLAKRIELYAASVHRDDGSPLQVKAAPVLQFAQGNKDENSHVTEPAGKEEPAAKQPPLNKAEESPTGDQGKHIPESITISGVCVDENKKPIAGARVRLFVEHFHYDDISQRELQEVRSDNEGKFALKDVNVQTVRERHEALVATAQSPGKTTAVSRLMEADNAADNAAEKAIELKLTPATTLQGRIVDDDGKPVAGAIVSAGCSLIEPVAGICAAITDANGHYEIPDLFPFDLADQKPQPLGKGTFAVTTRCYANVRHPDYARQVISYTKTPDTVDATIHRAAIVEGRIVLAESNEPAAGVEVEFSSDDTAADYWTRTKTDGDGKYRLATLPLGNYRLSTTLKDRPNVFKSNVPLISGINTLDLPLERGAVIKGRVIDVSTGRPVAFGKDEQMQINQHDSHGTSYAGMNHAEVQPDGTFTLHLPAGRPYLAMYLDPNWSLVGNDPMFADRFEVAEGETHEVELRVQPPNAAGNNAPKPSSQKPQTFGTPAEKPSGSSSNSPISPAAVVQIAQTANDEKPPAAEPAEKKDDLPAKQAPPNKTTDSITLAGTCVDERGKPVDDVQLRLFRWTHSDTMLNIPSMSAKAQVLFTPPGFPQADSKDAKSPDFEDGGLGVSQFFVSPDSQRLVAEARSDSGGRFQFPKLPVDEAWLTQKDMVQIVIQSPGKATQIWPVYKDRTPQPLKVKLTKAYSLRGKLTNENDDAVAGAWVCASDSLFKPIPGVLCALTDAQGCYELTDLTPASGVVPYDYRMPVMINDYKRVANVRHPDYAPTVIAYDKLPAVADKVLKRPASLSAHVVLDENDRPADRVNVQVVPQNGYSGTVSDADGKAVISQLLPGKTIVTAQSFVPGMERPIVRRTVELKAGDNSIELRLKKGGFIKGRLVDDATGQPMHYIGTVFAFPAGHDPKEIGELYGEGYVDQEGSFSIAVPPGKTTLSVLAETGYTLLDADRWSKTGVEVAEGQTVEVELRVAQWFTKAWLTGKPAKQDNSPADHPEKTAR